MAEHASAHPRGTFAFGRTLAMGTCRWAPSKRLWPESLAGRALRVAAAGQLGALAAFQLLPGQTLPPVLLILSGLALVLLALNVHLTPARSLGRSLLTPVAVPSTHPPQTIAFDAVTPFTKQAFALDEQAQRLAEIAGSTTRAGRAPSLKTRAWADLMAQVSHEIRTPLNAVIGFSDVMTAEIFGPVGHPRYREYVDHIRESGRALLKSAEDTLALTQLLAEPGAPAQAPIALDLRGVLSESWSYHAGAARLRSVTLALDIEPCIELLGDRRLINPIFLNLFAEAIARAGDGARVTLSAHADGDLAAIEIALDRAQSLRAPGEASLPLSLARALLELQDAFLVELPAGPGTWKAATMMARATQQDFFADRRAAALETAYVS